VSTRSRPPSARYRRYGRPRRRRGRGLAWIVLIVAMVVAVGLALGRDVFDDDPPAAVETAPPPPQRLLIREGLRREDVAAILDGETAIAGDRYLALTAPGRRGARLARADRPTSLEGFLFPATYEVTETTTAKELVDEQIAAFRANTDDIDYRYAASRNLTRFDVLIIASMIEREVAVPSERRIVAGVIYNRLRARMRLDIDATVQYAIGAWRPLTARDLEVDSPYNTRRLAGLPPGPIASPGVDSIRAAARPARTRHRYYVARNDGTGRHYFARTAQAHEANVQRAAANG